MYITNISQVSESLNGSGVRTLFKNRVHNKSFGRFW